MKSEKDNTLNNIDLFYLSKKRQPDHLNTINDRLNNSNLVNDISNNRKTIIETTNKLLQNIINDEDILITNDNILYIEYFKVYLRCLLNDINLSKNVIENQLYIDNFLQDISYSDIKMINKKKDISNNYSTKNDINLFSNIDSEYISRQTMKKFVINYKDKKKILPKKK